MPDDHVHVIQEIRQSLAVIEERIGTLIQKSDSFAIDVRHLDKKYEEVSKGLALEQLERKQLINNVQELKNWMDGFWPKTIGVMVSIATIITSIGGIVAWLLR